MKKRLIKKMMTLVELLVVLTIMAAVATVALTGADEMMEHARTDETVRRGNLIADTINGNGSSASRFIGDMGRLPRVISLSNGKILSELWDSNLVDSNAKWSDISFDNSSNAWPETGSGWENLPASIEVPCGWRGPYLNISKDELYDGYGNEWNVNTNSWSSETWENNSAASLDDKIYGVQSLGRDYASGGTEWYDSDRNFKLAEGACESSLTVTLKYINATPDPDVPANLDSSFMDRVRVAVFTPYVRRNVKSAKRILAQRNGTLGATTSSSILPSAVANYSHPESATWEDYHIVKFSDLTPGPRKLYAYGYLNAGTANKYSSGIIHLDLKPGSNSITVYLVRCL